MSRSLGRGSASEETTVNSKPVHKSSSLDELKRIEKGKFYKLSELKFSK